MTTKQLGNIGEAKTLCKFVELQIPVYQAFGDNEKSDLIAEFNGVLKRIQVKASEFCKKDKISFSLVSSTVHRKNGVKHKYTSKEIDYFALYNLETNILLLVPIEILEGQTQISFRLDYKPSQNQFKSLNWKQFTFEKTLNINQI